MKYFLTGILLFALVRSFAQTPVNTAGKQVVFRNVNVIPMDQAEVLSERIVIVSNGRIISIGKEGSVPLPGDALIVDGSGKYLMPGLAEMHAHVPPNDNLQEQKDVVLLFALHGITMIRGMLGHPSHLELRKKLASGEILGPTLYTSGPSLSGSSVKVAEDAERIVREEKKAGYDFLKIHPGLSPENFEAMVAAANQSKIRFAGHIPFSVGVWKSIQAGYQTIDHLDGFVEGLVPGIENIKESESGLFGMYVAGRADENRIPELMKELKQHNVWVVPTQALAERWMTSARNAESFRRDPEMKYMDTKTLDNWVSSKTGMQQNAAYDSSKIADYIKLRRKLILACQNSGVGLLLGCDAPQVFNVPGIATHHELKYLVDAGLTPFQALQTGTVNVAKFYNRVGELGVVKKGAVSDLVLLSANPLDDISNTMKIEGVMLGKNWLTKEYIDQALKNLEKSN